MIRRFISSILLVTFGFLSVVTPDVAAQLSSNIPISQSPNHLISSAPIFSGIKIYPQEPFRFDFIMNNDVTGNGERETGTKDVRYALPVTRYKDEVLRLVKYFMASLTVPEGDLWVNLSPYEPDRIVPQALGQTDMGRDMLAQDYILKQLTSSLMNPETETGKKLWDTIYSRAYEKFGQVDIPVDTFHKVWIVPNQVSVFQNQDTAYIVNADFKVMLEEDYYLMSSQRKLGPSDLSNDTGSQVEARDDSFVVKDIIKEIIIPVIEQEVNEGPDFAILRQIFHSMILAKWYEQHFKKSILGQSYIDRNLTEGIAYEKVTGNEERETGTEGVRYTLPGTRYQSVDDIYNQYVQAFQQASAGLIKEDYDPATQQIVSRQYFTGGVGLTVKGFDDAALNEVDLNETRQVVALDLAMMQDFILDVGDEVLNQLLQHKIGLKKTFEGQRRVEFYPHKEFPWWDQITDNDRRNIKRVMTSNDASTRIYKNAQTTLVQLEKPIVNDWGEEIEFIQLKRVSFDESKGFMAHYGGGYNEEAYDADEDGRIRMYKGTPGPQGGMPLKKAANEFLITEELKSRLKTDRRFRVRTPMGVGVFPDAEFNGQRLGFVALGLTASQKQRWIVSHFKGFKYGISFDKQEIIETFRVIGWILRGFHDLGYSRVLAHPGNVSIPYVDIDTLPTLYDFENTRSSSWKNYSEAQKLAFRFIDVAYMFNVANRDKSWSQELRDGSLKGFLTGYFGSDVDLSRVLMEADAVRRFKNDISSSVPDMNLALVSLLKQVASEGEQGSAYRDMSINLNVRGRGRILAEHLETIIRDQIPGFFDYAQELRINPNMIIYQVVAYYFHYQRNIPNAMQVLFTNHYDDLLDHLLDRSKSDKPTKDETEAAEFLAREFNAILLYAQRTAGQPNSLFSIIEEIGPYFQEVNKAMLSLPPLSGKTLVTLASVIPAYKRLLKQNRELMHAEMRKIFGWWYDLAPEIDKTKTTREESIEQTFEEWDARFIFWNFPSHQGQLFPISLMLAASGWLSALPYGALSFLISVPVSIGMFWFYFSKGEKIGQIWTERWGYFYIPPSTDHVSMLWEVWKKLVFFVGIWGRPNHPYVEMVSDIFDISEDISLINDKTRDLLNNVPAASARMNEIFDGMAFARTLQQGTRWSDVVFNDFVIEQESRLSRTDLDALSQTASEVIVQRALIFKSEDQDLRDVSLHYMFMLMMGKTPMETERTLFIDKAMMQDQNLSLPEINFSGGKAASARELIEAFHLNDFNVIDKKTFGDDLEIYTIAAPPVRNEIAKFEIPEIFREMVDHKQWDAFRESFPVDLVYRRGADGMELIAILPNAEKIKSFGSESDGVFYYDLSPYYVPYSVLKNISSQTKEAWSRQLELIKDRQARLQDYLRDTGLEGAVQNVMTRNRQTSPFYALAFDPKTENFEVNAFDPENLSKDDSVENQFFLGKTTYKAVLLNFPSVYPPYNKGNYSADKDSNVAAMRAARDFDFQAGDRYFDDATGSGLVAAIVRLMLKARDENIPMTVNDINPLAEANALANLKYILDADVDFDDNQVFTFITSNAPHTSYVVPVKHFWKYLLLARMERYDDLRVLMEADRESLLKEDDEWTGNAQDYLDGGLAGDMYWIDFLARLRDRLVPSRGVALMWNRSDALDVNDKWRAFLFTLGLDNKTLVAKPDDLSFVHRLTNTNLLGRRDEGFRFYESFPWISWEGQNEDDYQKNLDEGADFLASMIANGEVKVFMNAAGQEVSLREFLADIQTWDAKIVLSRSERGIVARIEDKAMMASSASDDLSDGEPLVVSDVLRLKYESLDDFIEKVEQALREKIESGAEAIPLQLIVDGPSTLNDWRELKDMGFGESNPYQADVFDMIFEAAMAGQIELIRSDVLSQTSLYESREFWIDFKDGFEMDGRPVKTAHVVLDDSRKMGDVLPQESMTALNQMYQHYDHSEDLKRSLNRDDWRRLSMRLLILDHIPMKLPLERSKSDFLNMLQSFVAIEGEDLVKFVVSENQVRELMDQERKRRQEAKKAQTQPQVPVIKEKRSRPDRPRIEQKPLRASDIFYYAGGTTYFLDDMWLNAIAFVFQKGGVAKSKKTVDERVGREVYGLIEEYFRNTSQQEPASREADFYKEYLDPAPENQGFRDSLLNFFSNNIVVSFQTKEAFFHSKDVFLRNFFMTVWSEVMKSMPTRHVLRDVHTAVSMNPSAEVLMRSFGGNNDLLGTLTLAFPYLFLQNYGQDQKLILEVKDKIGLFYEYLTTPSTGTEFNIARFGSSLVVLDEKDRIKYEKALTDFYVRIVPWAYAKLNKEFDRFLRDFPEEMSRIEMTREDFDGIVANMKALVEEWQKPLMDKAMMAVDRKKGGIDLNNLNMQTSGTMAPVEIKNDPAMMNVPIQGLVPRIIDIQTMKVIQFLGMEDAPEDSSSDVSFEPSLKAVRRES